MGNQRSATIRSPVSVHLYGDARQRGSIVMLSASTRLLTQSSEALLCQVVLQTIECYGNAVYRGQVAYRTKPSHLLAAHLENMNAERLRPGKRNIKPRCDNANVSFKIYLQVKRNPSYQQGCQFPHDPDLVQDGNARCTPACEPVSSSPIFALTSQFPFFCTDICPS